MMITAERAPRLRAEGGFTLIELLVYISFFVLVLSIVGGFLINSLQAESTVRSGGEAATSGQLIVESVQHGVRNARAIRLVPGTAPGTELLLAYTAGGNGDTATWSCQAWYYSSASGGSVITKRTALVPIAEPTTAEAVSGWLTLGENVSRVHSGPIFSLASTQTVNVSFAVDAGTALPVVIATAASSQVVVTGGTPCFA
jgi:hypothetical protein